MMATREELYTALRNADKAGDVEGAKKLATHIQSMPVDAPPSEPTMADYNRAAGKQAAQDLVQGIGNTAAGFVRGAGSIGATIVAPYDMIQDARQGKGLSLAGNRERRRKIDEGLRMMGAEPETTTYGAGKLAGEIAGTAGVGGVLANGVRVIAPGAAPLINAVATGGMRAGTLPAAASLGARAANMGIRMAGGGITGAAAAGLANPDDAVYGGLIGAALPPTFAAVGKAMGIAGKGINALRTPPQVQLAQTVLNATGDGTPQAAQALRGTLAARTAPSITGARATVPEIVQQPGVSQLQRTLKNNSNFNLVNRQTENNAARIAALNGISPVTGSVQQAAENVGNAVEQFARPAYKADSMRVNQLFAPETIDPGGTSSFLLPVERFNMLSDKFLGPGTVGMGNKFNALLKEADGLTAAGMGTPDEIIKSRILGADGNALSQQVVPGMPRQGVSYRELQNLRSSMGNAARDIKGGRTGANAESTAIEQAIAEIDDHLLKVGSGAGVKDVENFPPAMMRRYREALDAYIAKKQRFSTGPQVNMFRDGSDSQASAQGAELAGKFFNAGRSQVEDAASFKRLVGDSPKLLAGLKNYAITDAARQTDQMGTLSASKLDNWLSGRSGALRETFDPAENAMLKQINDEVQAAYLAENLGRATGSNTAQNVQSAMSLGLLDSPVVDFMAHRIPGVRAFSGPILDSMRNTAKQSKAAQLDALLADPQLLHDALGRYLQLQQPTRIGTATNRLIDKAAPTVYRAAPLTPGDRQ
ncbi:hypothetical protein [Janthinobacterium sp. RA13]|uniref:hypothetical protein n=1 Tax=Janthinobacterium sp. RA13 TaxID=1502762 RepID=UPI001269C8C1|nr:hypothetical protein [Janthinobacterium sp. RA13]